MRLYGLTGGIGMGKSTAAECWLELGAAVVDTDDLARTVLQRNSDALHELRQRFGGSVLDEVGNLNRRVLADLIFEDSSARERVHTIVHPRVRHLWQEIVSGWRRNGVEIGVVVIPLLFETQSESTFDSVVAISTTFATQIKRVEQRGWRIEELERRSRAQLSPEEKVRRADHVLWNESSREILLEQIVCVNGTE